MLKNDSLTKWLYEPTTKKRIVQAVLFIFIVFAIHYLYSVWNQRFEARAYAALAELHDRYEGALHIGAEESLRELLEDSEKLYQQYRSSRLAPYFLIHQAQLLSFIEGYERARDTLEQACSILNGYSDSYPLTLFYSISLANLMLNSGNDEDKEHALTLLKKCSSVSSNPYHEMALYFHGLYLFNNVSLEDAERVWAPLFNDPVYQDSLWRTKALMSKDIA